MDKHYILIERSLPVNEHKAQADSISTVVKLTGSLRGLWGIENISLMFAMSATYKADEARVMQECSSGNMILILHSSGGNIP